ncbi:MAG: hypothetical protein ACLFVC_06290 [Opitutales bacterium]
MATSIPQIERIQPTHSALDTLFKHRGGLCLSIYLPVKTDPPSSDKNPIRLRNLLGEARRALGANGMNDEVIDKLLAPLEERVRNPEKLLDEAGTLAFFLDGNRAESIALPFKVEPVSFVGNRFLIKPLVKLRQENPSYTALCLNRGSVRVLRGTRSHIEEVPVPDMPANIEEVTDIDNPEESLQHHTSDTVSSEGRPGSAPFAHIHGQGLPSDLERSQLDRFLRAVAKALDAYLSENRDPLVIFGVEQNVGILKSIHSFENRTVLDKHHDPHKWNEATIREEAWKLLRPACENALQEKRNQLEAARNQGATIDLVSEAALAACMGQLKLAAVAIDREKPGICDVDSGEVRLIEEGQPGCAHDLLDLIASETLLHGGDAIVLDSADLPGGSEVVASKRF